MLISVKCENGFNLILFYKFLEIIDVIEDEFLRYGIIIVGFVRFKFCFLQDGIGIVIVGNVFGINDGFVVVVLMFYVEVIRKGVVFMVRIVFWGQVGVESVVMGIGFIFVIRKVVSNQFVLNLIIYSYFVIKFVYFRVKISDKL